jgi:Right handed beta helix region/Ser-Thr-rich glycosyl-phosphatidyl-inositol-anchored membrane family/Fibronectin type III domain
VTSPNGGEVMTVGNVYTITWQSSPSIDTVSIMYKSCPSCGDWIAFSIPNTGSYSWTVNVGNTSNTQFTIEITGYQTGVGSVTDDSDAPFTVLPALTPTFTPTSISTLTPTSAGPWIVTSNADDGTTRPGNCPSASNCRLRDAIYNTRIGSNSQIITFAPGLSGQTITLSSSSLIAGSVTIDASGLALPIQISGNNAVGVFQFVGSGNVILNNLIIKNGFGPGGGEGISFLGNGNLTVNNSTFSGNTGGAISFQGYGNLTVNNSIFSGNTGSAIFNFSGNNLTVNNSTFSGNTASSSGGAIDNNGGNLTVNGSTFSGNTSALKGGAIYNYVGSVGVANSTFSGNVASGNGGGIYNQTGSLLVRNSTFSNNSAGGSGGGGIANSGSLLYDNTIIANSTGGDCINSGTLNSGSTNNLVEDGSCPAALSLSGNPQLGPLANNGGPTQTFALLANSPAIDAGSDTLCTSTDQRGVSRPQGAHCDIGAYEFVGNAQTNTPTPTNTLTVTPTYTPTFTPAYTPTASTTPTIAPTNTPTNTSAPTPTPTINPLWLTVTSPNGGEVMTAGDVYPITWNSSPNIDTVSIMYKSCPSCGDWIAFSIPNTGSYNWTVDVGNTTNTQFTIEIIGYDTGVGSITDDSAAPFTVLPASTPTFTPTASDTPTFIPTDTPTFTPTASDTPTFTPTDTDTPAFTPTASDTPTFTPTDTDTPTFTPTASDTPTFTPTDTDTPTFTPTASDTPTFTPTDTPTYTPTSPNTPTFTPTYTPTASNTSTYTPTASTTPAFTPTVPTPTSTRTLTPTFTPTVPKLTNTATATRTPTFTPTVPKPTNTVTATRTPTATPTPVLPGAFNKSSPANNSLKQPTNPILKWSASAHATSYQYCYDTTNDNTCTTSWISNGTSTSASLSGLLPNTTYYWQVRAVNAAGVTYANAGIWWSFEIVLAPPTLTSPVNGATDVGTRPHFTWSDPNTSGVTGYTIQISKNNTFTSLVVTGNATTNTFTPSANLPAGTLYWRVEVNGSNGPSAWSAYFTFSTS